MSCKHYYGDNVKTGQMTRAMGVSGVIGTKAS